MVTYSITITSADWAVYMNCQECCSSSSFALVSMMRDDFVRKICHLRGMISGIFGIIGQGKSKKARFITKTEVPIKLHIKFWLAAMSHHYLKSWLVSGACWSNIANLLGQGMGKVLGFCFLSGMYCRNTVMHIDTHYNFSQSVLYLQSLVRDDSGFTCTWLIIFQKWCKVMWSSKRSQKPELVNLLAQGVSREE